MTAHVFVFGFVQGVGYRQAVKRKARALGLSGWVKNLSDGRVEATFCGPKDTINEAIEFCKKGPFFAQVKHVEVEWEDKDYEYKGFEVNHD